MFSAFVFPDDVDVDVSLVVYRFTHCMIDNPTTPFNSIPFRKPLFKEPSVVDITIKSCKCKLENSEPNL